MQSHTDLGAFHDLTTLALSDSPGPGPVMRSVIVISVLGVAFLAWFLLRGYRGGGE
ncbi:hypothetical protein ABZ901_30175 [Actinacidiphila alni]|uniref:Uncharacterized protein n=1 Tax=Actinacidiphila alni TaxID=380248 RepID=A0A1I2B3Y8_9ACTN|nr:hypothetical protein [Actinacidiphila alni]SFE50895.1 hypothetical protein SAMN05216251_103345 [Actinacidiphila alni]